MSSPQYSVVFSAPVAGTVTAGSVGDVLIPDATSGLYVKATTANRGTRRSTGIALSAYATGGVTDIQQYGQVDTVTAGLGAGTASWVRVSTTGSLERAAVSGSDDVVGWVETDGTFHAAFGYLTAAIVNGGTGGTVPTGTGIPHIVGGAQNAAASLIVDADVTSVGVAKLTGLGTNVATFLGTPSGANLASALTTALPVSKGGTNLTALVSAMAALAIDWSVAPSFTKTLAAGGNTITFTNQVAGQTIVVRLTGAASTVTWPTVKWPAGAVPTQTASGIDVYTFFYDGTSTYGSVVQAMA